MNTKMSMRFLTVEVSAEAKKFMESWNSREMNTYHFLRGRIRDSQMIIMSSSKTSPTDEAIIDQAVDVLKFLGLSVDIITHHERGHRVQIVIEKV